jgi:hypothetical protein
MLEACVVVGADRRQLGDLFAAEAGHATIAGRIEAGGLRVEVGAASAEKCTELFRSIRARVVSEAIATSNVLPGSSGRHGKDLS